MINKGLFTSNTDLWATPQVFFDQLNEEFHFTLDPCANDDNHKCQIYFTKEQDGLKQDWRGYRVFCNPPYGRTIGAWVKKCHDEAQKGTLVVMLIPARTDTSYFHDYIYHKAELRFIRGRLKFGNAKCGAPFPSMVVVFNPPHNLNVKLSSRVMKTKLCQESMSCFDCPNHIQDPYTADYCLKFDCYCADAKK